MCDGGFTKELRRRSELCELYWMPCTLTRRAAYRVSRVPASPGLRPQASCGRGRGARRAAFDWGKTIKCSSRSQKVSICQPLPSQVKDRSRSRNRFGSILNSNRGTRCVLSSNAAVESCSCPRLLMRVGFEDFLRRRHAGSRSSRWMSPYESALRRESARHRYADSCSDTK